MMKTKDAIKERHQLLVKTLKRKEQSLAQLSEVLGVTKLTVYKDIKTLKEQGFTITSRIDKKTLLPKGSNHYPLLWKIT